MLTIIKDREREAESAAVRLQRVQQELAASESRLEAERNNSMEIEANYRRAQNDAQSLHIEMTSPQRLEPVPIADSLSTACYLLSTALHLLSTSC